MTGLAGFCEVMLTYKQVHFRYFTNFTSFSLNLEILQISFQTKPMFSKLSNRQMPLLAVAQAVRMTLPMQRQNPFPPPVSSASDS